jgi:hypothetical protein
MGAAAAALIGAALSAPPPAVAAPPGSPATAAVLASGNGSGTGEASSLLCIGLLAVAAVWAVAKRRRALRSNAIPPPAADSPATMPQTAADFLDARAGAPAASAQPTTPTQPGNPGQTDAPAQPTAPAQANAPTQATAPTQANAPTQAGRSAQPDGPAQPGGEAPGARVDDPVDAKIGRARLRADGDGIALGERRLAWSQVESVNYQVTRMYSAHGVFRTGAGSQWLFSVLGAGEEITVRREHWQTKLTDDPVWSALARLSQRHVEPRLIAGVVGRVLAGETVAVIGAGGQWLTVHPGGLRGRGGHKLVPVELSWAEFVGTSASDGWLWIFRSGAEQPVIQIPVQQLNAVLVPTLLATLSRRSS